MLKAVTAYQTLFSNRIVLNKSNPMCAIHFLGTINYCTLIDIEHSLTTSCAILYIEIGAKAYKNQLFLVQIGASAHTAVKTGFLDFCKKDDVHFDFCLDLNAVLNKFW